ncbi:MAG: DNA-processing protein DprA [Gammaproteobacteria bacterium]|jgi:DNA processing protein
MSMPSSALDTKNNNLNGAAQKPEPTSGLKYWLALLRAPGVGCSTFSSLLEQFVSPEEVFAAAHGNFLRDVSREVTLNYLRNPNWDAVEEDLRWLSQDGNGVLTLHDPHYPTLLREIHDPPPLLFYRGEPSLLNHPQMAIVGSRNPSHTGMDTALAFAKHLSEAGFVITSGLALGIDTAAHQGALAARKLTIAVAGTGLDRVYPARNRELAHQIADHGVLISEFVPGTPPLAANFPRRNRIISGLSIGTLVVEAARQSGSLITARMAMEQSREVFAIPGSIHNPLARGCHALIRQGAKLVETASDIMEELSPLMRLMYSHQPSESPDHRPASATASGGNSNNPYNQEFNELLPTAEHQQLYTQLGYEPTSIDTLVERSQLTTETVSAMLVELELKGCVTSTSGLYSRTH